jgi:hypothetical protein
MYEPPTSWLWQFGTWVNGGHWSTCEARMVMGYYRLGHYEDARRSMRQLMTFARAFRMDNPLVDFGARVYQPGEPINLCYDSFGPPAAMIRGLFEYLYDSQGLTLLPHIPPGVTRLEQHFPIRFGRKRLYLATTGSGPVTAVLVNGEPWTEFDQRSIRLTDDQTPQAAVIEICLGGAAPESFTPRKPDPESPLPPSEPDPRWAEIEPRVARIGRFHQRLVAAGLADRYEASHARLAVEYLATTAQRLQLRSAGKLARLAEPSQSAADRSYVDTVVRLYEGLERTVEAYQDAEDPEQRRVYALWVASH